MTVSGDDGRANGLREALLRELGHHHSKPLPSSPSMAEAAPHFVEEKLRRVWAFMPSSLEILAPTETGPSWFDQKQRHTFGAAVESVCGQHDDIAQLAVGNEHLLPEMTKSFHRGLPCADRLQMEARMRLRHAELTRSLQPETILGSHRFFCAFGPEDLCKVNQVAVNQKARPGHTRPGHLFEHDHVEQVVPPIRRTPGDGAQSMPAAPAFEPNSRGTTPRVPRFACCGRFPWR